MAEHSFQEVMRQWVRARKAIDENTLCSWPLETFTDDYIANIEKEVMQWAAEHPEPVYPLWFEWLEKIGVAGRAYDLEPYFIGDNEILLKTAAFTAKAFEPIPADIAEKLGIEPKEE